jgi:hypothetical protein
MNVYKLIGRATGAIVFCAAATAALAYDQAAPRDASAGNARCESARLSAWFDRQRQLTDGDVDPYKVAADPAECGAKRASNDAGGSAPGYESSLASASRSSVATSETAQYSMPARRQ